MSDLPVIRTRNRVLWSPGRRGVSLVEVLVVLVVLIVGFAAMARLFPEGFASLGYTANATQATAFMKFREDALRQAQENLPDAVAGIDPNSGAIRASLTPQDFLGVFRQFNISGTLVDDPRFSDVNQARRVIGEHLVVPPPGTAPNGERASLYRPLFGPLYSTSAMAPAALGLSVYAGTPLRRVVFQDPPAPENWFALSELGDFGYGIDYDRQLLYFNPSPISRDFKLEYTFHATGGARGHSPSNLTITITPNSTTYSLTGALGGAALDHGSEFLHRRFVDRTGNAFTADPYEYKVYDSIFGLIGFNPLASVVPLPKQQGRGLTAQLDYDVDDWHILHEDANITLQPADPDGSLLSSGTPTGDEAYVIKLSSNALKKLQETEDTVNFVAGQPITSNTYEYLGLQRYYPDTPSRTGTPGVDLVIVDLETGFQIDSRTLQKGGNNGSGEIDYDAGVIHLWKYQGRSSGNPLQWSLPFSMQGGSTTTVGLDPAGRRVRVYFRTYNDIGVATFKPYNRYFMQTNPAVIQARDYFPYQYGYVLFPPMDGEKTVALDYRYLARDPSDPSNASRYQLRQVLAEMHQVTMPGTPASPPIAAPYNRLWWARVAHADPSAAGDPAGDPDVVPGSVVVTGVRGASIHTHVVWKDGSRWRHRQRATVLTRQESR